MSQYSYITFNGDPFVVRENWIKVQHILLGLGNKWAGGEDFYNYPDYSGGCCHIEINGSDNKQWMPTTCNPTMATGSGGKEIFENRMDDFFYAPRVTYEEFMENYMSNFKAPEPITIPSFISLSDGLIATNQKQQIVNLLSQRAKQ